MYAPLAMADGVRDKLFGLMKLSRFVKTLWGGNSPFFMAWPLLEKYLNEMFFVALADAGTSDTTWSVSGAVEEYI